MTRAPRRDSGEGTRFATKCDGVRARGAEQHTTWTTVAQLRVTRGAVSETSRQKFALGCLVPACLAARTRAEDRSRRERSSCIERRGRKGDSQSGLGTGEARAGERQGPTGNGRELRAGGGCLFLFWMRHARKRRRRRREQVARSRVEDSRLWTSRATRHERRVGCQGARNAAGGRGARRRCSRLAWSMRRRTPREGEKTDIDRTEERGMDAAQKGGYDERQKKRREHWLRRSGAAPGKFLTALLMNAGAERTRTQQRTDESTKRTQRG
ncbi:hypothetical protein ERJ75_000684400 [Trypanosoma vivax]|nr:hypothetical protein ERJ75_000684400 [Trypanosoma vivax]